MAAAPDHSDGNHKEHDDYNKRFSSDGLLAVLTVLSVMACNDRQTAPSASANLVVQLTDGHTDNVEQVNLYFTSVTANSASGSFEPMTVVSPTIRKTSSS
jgi:hypothetical protein